MNTTAYLDGQLELDLVQGLPPGSHVVALPSTFWNEGLAVAVDATGNYFIAGTMQQAGALSIPFVATQFTFAPYLVKLLSDGKTPDTTFNGGLPLIIPMGFGTTPGHDGECTDIYVDPSSGLITLGGILNDDNLGNFTAWVARVNANGTMQATFGTNGVVKRQRTSITPTAFMRIAVQKVGGNAGKVLIFCKDVVSGSEAGQLCRFNLDGSLDTTFNNPNGFQVSNLAINHVSVARAIAVDGTDQIYLGYNTPGDGTQVAGWFIERYSPAGAPAGTGWGAAGANACGVRTTFPQVVGSDLCEVIIDAAGKVVVVGQSGYNAGGNGQIQIGRYIQTTGALDTTFNTTGLASFDYHAIYQPNSSPSRAMLITGGDLVVAGVTVGTVAGQGFSDGGRNLLARYTMASPSVDVWHTILPFLGTSSEVDYGLGGQGWPAGPASNICAVGHDMNDIAVPRYAQAVASYYLLSGALDTTKGT